ncbi:hypothetical protein EXN66_Car013968 [Channa argus]|uniref:Uncharacterized protein n=1 Tax=Channa argus TaxID=215402 RepID=A0A6G1Q701_CHAAH|nr:hypothetical protein EXN66_Car013968 [Channa argus]
MLTEDKKSTIFLSNHPTTSDSLDSPSSSYTCSNASHYTNHQHISYNRHFSDFIQAGPDYPTA